MPNFVPIETPEEKRLRQMAEARQRFREGEAEPTPFLATGEFTQKRPNMTVGTPFEGAPEETPLSRVPREQLFGETVKRLNRPIVTPEMVEKLPGWAQPVGSAAREFTSPTSLAALAATAGAGPGLAASIRGGTGLVGKARGLVAGALEPVVRGGFGARLGAEAAMGVGAQAAAQETAKRTQNLATPLRVGLPLAAGLAGGVGTLGAIRAAPKVGARALDVAAEALPARQVLAHTPPKPVLTSKQFDEEIARLGRLRDKAKTPKAVTHLDEEIASLKELRQIQVEDALEQLPKTVTDELPVDKYREARQNLDETQAYEDAIMESQAGVQGPAPRFGSAERYEYDKARMRGRQAGASYPKLSEQRSKAQSKTGYWQREVEYWEAKADKILGVTPDEPQVGTIQSSMGIGEKPAQGGLFENLSPEGGKVPLANQESLVAAQARREAVAAGQRVLPEAAQAPAAGTLTRGVSTTKEPWQMTRAEFGVPIAPKDVVVPKVPFEKRAFRAGTASEEVLKDLERVRGLERQHQRYLRDHRAYVEKSNAHFRAVRQALSDGKPVPAEVLADYPDLARSREGRQAAEAAKREALLASDAERAASRMAAEVKEVAYQTRLTDNAHRAATLDYDSMRHDEGLSRQLMEWYYQKVGNEPMRLRMRAGDTVPAVEMSRAQRMARAEFGVAETDLINPAVAAPKAAEPDWADELASVGGKIEDDGTVVVYHATTKDKADQILKSGILRRPSDASDTYGVYVSTNPSVRTDYGDGTLVRLRVQASDMHPDDVFPGRRLDFSIPTHQGQYKPIAIEGIEPAGVAPPSRIAPTPKAPAVSPQAAPTPPTPVLPPKPAPAAAGGELPPKKPQLALPAPSVERLERWWAEQYRQTQRQARVDWQTARKGAKQPVSQVSPTPLLSRSSGGPVGPIAVPPQGFGGQRALPAPSLQPPAPSGLAQMMAGGRKQGWQLATQGTPRAAGGPPTIPPPTVGTGPFPLGASSFGVRYAEPTEELLRIGKDAGLANNMLRRAYAEAAHPVPAMNQLQRALNPINAFINPVKGYAGEVQGPFLAATRVREAGMSYVDVQMGGLAGALKESGGTREALTGAIVPELAQAHRGTVYPMQQAYVGTIRHFFDFPQQYVASGKWKRAAEEWKRIFDDDLHRMQASPLNVDVGEVHGIYVTQATKDPTAAEAALRAGRGRARPGVLKERILKSPEEFYEWADSEGLQVETDILNLGYNRLASTARMRSEVVFGDGLAALVGGARTKGPAQLGRGEALFTRRGVQWRLPQEAAAEAERILAPIQEATFDSAVNTAVNNMKAGLLTLDFSIGGGRQGMLAFYADPVGTVQGYASAVRSWTTPQGKAVWLAQNAEDIIRYRQAGLELGINPLELPTGNLPGSKKLLLEYIPGFRRFEEIQFNDILQPLKVNLTRRNESILLALKADKGLAGMIHKIPGIGPVARRLAGNIEKMSDFEITKAAVDGAQNQLGGIERARYQARRMSALRNMLLLTENWTRAQVGMVVNAPKLSPKGVLARRMLVQEIAMGVGIATAVNTLTGHDTSWDPRSRDFGRVWTPFGKISLLPHSSIIRLTSRGLGGVPEGEYGGATQNEAQERAGALLDYAEGRGGQVPHLIVDVSTGRDYYGRAIDNKAKYIATQLLPIPAQSGMAILGREETAAAKAIQAGIAFTGVSQSPVPQQEQLEAVAGKPWDELTRPQQGQVEMSEQGRRIREQGGGTVSQETRRIQYEFYDAQLKRDEALNKGRLGDKQYDPDDWINDYYEAEAERAIRTRRDGKFPEPTTPEAKALNDYYALSERFYDERAKSFDAARYREATEKYLASLTPELRKHIEDNLHPYATPRVTEYHVDRKRLQLYWNMDEAALQSRAPKERLLWTAYQRQTELVQSEWRKQFKVLSEIESDVRKRRITLRQKLPQIDTLLVKWGYVTEPLTDEGKMEKERQLAVGAGAK